jgi:YVTN family beta-propeller protein
MVIMVLYLFPLISVKQVQAQTSRFHSIADISVGNTPVAVAVNPNTNMIYVTNADDNTVSVIDGKTNNIVDTIKVGNNPVAVAVNPNTNILYVTNADDNSLSAINLSR